jgi:ABC-type transport system substrate-binding protein
VADIETPAPDRGDRHQGPTLIVPNYLSRALSHRRHGAAEEIHRGRSGRRVRAQAVGSGPYKFVEQVTGSHIKLAAVDNHWRIGAPKYKTMTFRWSSRGDHPHRAAPPRRGGRGRVSRERVKELQREGFPVQLRREESIFSMWWVLDPSGWPAPMKDKRVREAMNVAIDRGKSCKASSAASRSPHRFPMGLSWAFKDIGFKPGPEMNYTYDPARAKKLLADAGLGNGFPLDVYAFQLTGFPEGKAAAEAVAGYWEKIGIKTKLIPVDYPAFRKNWVDRKTPGPSATSTSPTATGSAPTRCSRRWRTRPASPTTPRTTPRSTA